MAASVNFDNATGELFNITLDAQGNLNFNANDRDGNGNRRMSVPDDSGTLVVGGGGRLGGLQLQDGNGGNTIFVGVDDPADEARIFLGGGASGLSGRVQLNVGGGGATIELRGVNGTITCANLIETSDARLKEDVAPLTDALDKVVALRGVRYRRTGADGEAEIGFIGQEVAGVCPELVDTDADGYVALSYSRLTAVLVEALKEQQRIIAEQSSTLSAVLRRISGIEAGLAAPGV